MGRIAHPTRRWWICGHLWLAGGTLMGVVARGEINSAPLVLMALWLVRERVRWRR